MGYEKYPRTWEIVRENLRRIAVPGGWIVHHSSDIRIGVKDAALSECMVFVPDKKHEWALAEK